MADDEKRDRSAVAEGFQKPRRDAAGASFDAAFMAAPAPSLDQLSGLLNLLSLWCEDQGMSVPTTLKALGEVSAILANHWPNRCPGMPPSRRPLHVDVRCETRARAAL